MHDAQPPDVVDVVPVVDDCVDEPREADSSRCRHIGEWWEGWEALHRFVALTVKNLVSWVRL